MKKKEHTPFDCRFCLCAPFVTPYFAGFKVWCSSHGHNVAVYRKTRRSAVTAWNKGMK